MEVPSQELMQSFHIAESTGRRHGGSVPTESNHSPFSKCDVLVSYCCLTNYHKPSGWKQCTFIVSHTWKSEVQNVPHWTAVKVLARCILSGVSRSESTLSFPTFRCHLHSLDHGTFFNFKEAVQPLQIPKSQPPSFTYKNP